jgi:inner membrane protein
MASSVGHAIVAVAVGTAFTKRPEPRRYWAAGVLCAVLIDIDAIGRPFHRGDIAMLGGHRAFTHSVLFAILLALAVTFTAFRDARWNGRHGRLVAYLALATLAHGAVDTLASYGSGVAFFYPFSLTRYQSVWRPLKALNEVYWIWLPALAVIAGLRYFRRDRYPELV